MHTLQQTAENNQPEILQDILDLVGVETYSTDLPALARGLEHVRALTIKHLGEPTDTTLDEEG